MHFHVLGDTRDVDEPDESLKERKCSLKVGQGMTIAELASALAVGMFHGWSTTARDA
jgi:hypothetical protein